METPQPPQVSVSGRIVIEGQLPAPSSASSENAPAPPSPPWWKFWRGSPETVLAKATVLLAIATGFLAGIALGQAWILATTDVSTRKAADAAIESATTLKTALQTVRENFRTEQRPVIWLTNIGTPEFILGNPTDNSGQIVWSWHMTNYGKTPALHMLFRQFMQIENRIESSYHDPTQSVGAPLPTYKDDFSTVISRPGISADEFKRLAETDRFIGISGNITYDDIYGAKYETTFCLLHLRSGAIGYCKEGNDIK